MISVRFQAKLNLASQLTQGGFYMTALSESEQELNNNVTAETGVNPADQFKIRKLSSDAPVRWLEQGIQDYKALMVPSTIVGMVYVVLGFLLMWLGWEYPIFITSLGATFLIIGPLVAVGFYVMSYELERGHKLNFIEATKSSWTFMKGNAISLFYFAMVLGVLMGVWALISAVTAVAFLDTTVVRGDFLGTVMAQDHLFLFLFAYALGALFIAVVAFSISVITAPMLTHRNVDVVTAMMTSIEVVKQNPTVMFTWALMIAVMVFVGSVLFFVGLAVTLPILGHASWHVYRDVLED